MDETEIAVSWRAAIILENGAPPIFGRMRTIGKNRAVVKVDHNLTPGRKCNLAIQLPKARVDEEMKFVEGQAVVSSSVLSAAQFYVTFQSLQIQGNGQALLDEQFRKYKEMRKGL